MFFVKVGTSIKLFSKFATAIRVIAIRTLKSYATGFWFKAQSRSTLLLLACLGYVIKIKVAVLEGWFYPISSSKSELLKTFITANICS